MGSLRANEIRPSDAHSTKICRSPHETLADLRPAARLLPSDKTGGLRNLTGRNGNPRSANGAFAESIH